MKEAMARLDCLFAPLKRLGAFQELRDGVRTGKLCAQCLALHRATRVRQAFEQRVLLRKRCNGRIQRLKQQHHLPAKQLHRIYRLLRRAQAPALHARPDETRRTECRSDQRRSRQPQHGLPSRS